MLELPLFTQIAIWIKVAAVICGLLALPLLIGTRRKRTPDKNDVAAIALIAFGFFLHGGVGTLLRFSPHETFSGYVLGWTGGSAEQHSSLFLYDLGFPPQDAASFPEAQSQNLFVARSLRNLIPSSFWDSNGKLFTRCEYRRWDRQITKIDALPVPGANELTAWHWTSHAEGRFWYLLETILALFLVSVCIVSFRALSKKIAERTEALTCTFPNRWTVRICLAVLALLVGLVIFVRASGRIFQYKAEVLLHRIQTLELRKSTWQDAEILRDEYSGHIQRFGRGPCDSSRCDFSIELGHSSGLLPDKLWKRIWTLAWNLAGGRWTEINASVTVRNGVVLGKSFHVMVPHRKGYALLASAATVRGWPLSGRRLNVPDPNIGFGAPGGCEVCEAIYANVTPFASAADIRDAFTFDLSCIGGTLRACTSVGRLMPVAAQHVYRHRSESEIENEMSKEPPPWTPAIVRRLGRDACSVAVVETIGVRIAGSETSAPIVAFRTLKELKGDLVDGRQRNYRCSSRRQLERSGVRLIGYRSGVEPPKKGTAVIAFWDDFGDVRAFVPATEENLTEAKQGIVEDSIDIP